MRTEKIFPLVFSMSVPMVISMLVNSLYNIVDSFYVARISEEAMTALSLVFPIQNIIHSVAVGFGVGINAVIAFYSGAGEKKKADCAATLGLVLALIHGILLTAITISVISPFLSAFTTEGEIISYGERYGFIVFGFTVIDVLGITMEKIFQAEGRMKVSMTALMTGCVVNIILDPLLIFGIGPFPELGIEGAAIATGLGQLSALLIYSAIARIRPLNVRIRLESLSLSSALLRRLYGIGIPATLNMALPSVLIAALNAILSAFSPLYVMILGIYYKLQTFLYLPASGFVQGMRPIIGYNYGAGETVRVRKIFLAVLLMCALIMLAGTVISLALPDVVISLFSESSETVMEGSRALRIISIGFIVSSVSVAASGALEGLGKGLPSLVISLLRYVVIIIPLSYILSAIMGVTGVWHAFWISELIAAAVSFRLLRPVLGC